MDEMDLTKTYLGVTKCSTQTESHLGYPMSRADAPLMGCSQI